MGKFVMLLSSRVTEDVFLIFHLMTTRREVWLVLSQSIWVTPFIKINGNMCFHWLLCVHDFFSINDFNEFLDTYNVNINFVEYYGIISTIPNN
jgi:hypothetical protein